MSAADDKPWTITAHTDQLSSREIETIRINVASHLMSTWLTPRGKSENMRLPDPKSAVTKPANIANMAVSYTDALLSRLGYTDPDMEPRVEIRATEGT